MDFHGAVAGIEDQPRKGGSRSDLYQRRQTVRQAAYSLKVKLS
jgi:hypothetical protein